MIGKRDRTGEYRFTKRNRDKTRAGLIAQLGGKCVHCGAKERLHFDHIIPSTKLFDISQNLTATVDKLDIEVRKCQLLCASCHGRKTASDNDGRTYHGKLSMYTNGKCRCNKCKKANAEYTRLYKDKHKK